MTGERDYSQYTSPALAAELLGLWRQFPQESNSLRILDSEIEDDLASIQKRANDDIDRREKSDHKKIVMERVANLIEISHLTPTGKKVLLRDLDTSYVLGVDHDSTGASRIALILGPDGGIFNEERVEELERFYYRDTAQWIAEDQAMREESTFEIEGRVLSKDEVREYFESIERPWDEYYGEPYMDLMASWRTEIVEKYGDEP